MKKLLLFSAALLCVATMHADPYGVITGTGTQTDPYVISDDDAWKIFANEANHATYWSEGTYIKLGGFISTNQMIGTDAHPFCGIFDGAGYNITLNISNDSERYNALFHYVGNATIRNVRTLGTVSGDFPCASGLVGCVDDEATTAVVIDRCRISTNVVGVTPVCGVIGRIDAGLNATISITNTLFDGSFSEKEGAPFFGGFVGEDGVGDLTIENCLFNPSNVGNCNLYYSRTFVYETSGYYNLTNAYYKFVVQTYKQGIDATSMTDADLYAGLGDEWTSSLEPSRHGLYMKDCTIGGIETYYVYGGFDVTVYYTLTDLYGGTPTEGTDYDVKVDGVAKQGAPGQVTLDTAGVHTITFIAREYHYHGHATQLVKVLQRLDGNGDINSPYLIKDSTDWSTFVENVSYGYDANRLYMLSNNFDNSSSPVTEMVGLRDDFPFCGVFDGNGKTLHVNLNNEKTDGTNVQGIAPFHYIRYAIIRNLTVEGTIASASYHTAGLVGFAERTNTIENCHISVTIHQNNNHAGGIVGHGLTSTTTIKDCIFDGTIDGGTVNRTNIGGIWGWSDDGAIPSLQNCLEKGTYTHISSMHPMGLMKNNGSISGSYYLNPQIGSPSQVCTLSGYKRAYREAPAMPTTPIYKQVELLDGEMYWLTCASHVRKNYRYTGEVISLKYSVMDDKSNTLTEGTDYTIFILDSNRDTVDKANLVAEGDYKMAFTAAGECIGSDTLTFAISDSKVTVTSSTTTMEDNIYEVNSDVTINSRINISGDVELFLNEGNTLTASKGILLSQGNKLTIYGPGTLTATGENLNSGTSSPGIGAYRFGTLVINGGTINATGGGTAMGGAGIGGESHNGSGGSIIINGGVVNAQGGPNAAGIGGGYRNWSGDYGVPMDEIIINGGQVTAIYGEGDTEKKVAIGHGGYSWAINGTLTLNWTNEDDFIEANSYGGFNNIVLLKTFIDADGELHTPENPNLNGLKLMPYQGAPTDVDETIVNRKSLNRKFIKDGQLFILRDGKLYNAQGALVERRTNGQSQ